MRDIAAETSQLTAELIECNRRDYGQVRRMLDRIAELVDIHVNATTNKYLYEDDFGGPAQPDPFNETIGETGLQLLQRHCTPWLVSVLNRPPAVPATTHGSDAGDGDEAPTEEDLVDDISAVMSQLCGRAATGACSTVWNLQHTGSYSLQETTYTEAEIGFQTWGGGVMLAK
nr:hypothetical protein HK105_008198 [Polyrhizophydium stewartii]